MQGYISLTEEDGDWGGSDPKFPITLKASDFITLFQDDDGNQGSDESSLVRHLYHLSYNIWESIIRDAMQQEIIAVTPELISRFLTPVITDHNNSLLHHISYNRINQL